MNANDKLRFAQSVGAFAATKNRTVTAAEVQLYWDALLDWSIEEFEQVARYLFKTFPYFPSPADFEKVRRAGELQAPEAWAMVLKKIRSGAYRFGSLDDVPADVKHTVEACGGWFTIGMASEHALASVERSFLRHYDHLREIDRARSGAPAVARTPVGALTTMSERAANLGSLEVMTRAIVDRLAD